MKRLSKKEVSLLEEKIYSVGVDLSIVTSLIKFLDIALNDEIEVTDMDLANLTLLLKQQILEVNHKYDKIECLLDV